MPGKQSKAAAVTQPPLAGTLRLEPILTYHVLAAPPSETCSRFQHLEFPPRLLGVATSIMPRQALTLLSPYVRSASFRFLLSWLDLHCNSAAVDVPLNEVLGLKIHGFLSASEELLEQTRDSHSSEVKSSLLRLSKLQGSSNEDDQANRPLL
ncbi:hypothetical protein CVT26_005107 [Gymnopilus dilepis]|uniref:Uncharacterized protein n=1 Tax=Gymnopilus dilepis TaxID=231916 RepID=A0A409Y076_9AGAR|nr:hypothetical protein CVT26_005107 [Gymnopilus dilepis]